jgi:hypothetical protein
MPGPICIAEKQKTQSTVKNKYSNLGIETCIFALAVDLSWSNVIGDNTHLPLSTPAFQVPRMSLECVLARTWDATSNAKPTQILAPTRQTTNMFARVTRDPSDFTRSDLTLSRFEASKSNNHPSKTKGKHFKIQIRDIQIFLFFFLFVFFSKRFKRHAEQWTLLILQENFFVEVFQYLISSLLFEIETNTRGFEN